MIENPKNLNSEPASENPIPVYTWHNPKEIASIIQDGVSVTIFNGTLKFEIMPPGFSKLFNGAEVKYLAPSGREVKAKPITREKAKELGVEVIVGENGSAEVVKSAGAASQGNVSQKMFTNMELSGNFKADNIAQTSGGSTSGTQEMFTGMRIIGDLDLGNLSQG